MGSKDIALPIFIVCLSVTFASCCWECSTEIIHRPEVPKEMKEVKFIYPKSPPVVSFDELKENFTVLSDQLTILYVIGDTCVCSAYNNLRFKCLRDTQNQFYRYGVQVILLDLHKPTYWKLLRTHLISSSANFPAMFLKHDDLKKLSDYLHIDVTRSVDYRIFVIDEENDIKIMIPTILPCMKFKMCIKEILQERTELGKIYSDD